MLQSLHATEPAQGSVARRFSYTGVQLPGGSVTQGFSCMGAELHSGSVTGV